MNINRLFILKTLSIWLVLFFVGYSLMADNRAFRKDYKYKKGEARLALIIGNSAYRDSPLKNPVNDATDIAKTIKSMGFKVMLLKNANHREMGKAITSFGKQLKVNRGVGLFFYAGHGMQVKGRNYLIPVKSNIGSEDDIEYSAIDAGRVLSKMESAGNPLNIVILDDCRNNPFARSFRSGSRGLAQMEAPSGSLVVYATGPGSVAADGDGRNGIFTKHFLRQMKTSNQDVEIMLRGVRRGVMADTDGRQTPWSSSSLQGSFKFKTGTTVAGGSFEVEGDASSVGRVKVSTTPSNSKIYINNSFKGNSPLTLSLSTGTYKVKAKKPGYKSESETIRIRSGKSVNLTLLLDRIAASLWIKTNPQGAKIYLNNEYYGVTPDTIKDLNAGTYSVKISKKGYQTWQQRVSLDKGREKELDLNLRRKSGRSGMVMIPAGEFEMGSNSGDKDEKPVHRVQVDEFYIDKYEVTVANYRKCVNSGACQEFRTQYWSGKDQGTSSYCNWTSSGRDNHPINCVDWKNAKNYCQFANKRLPTEAEWEKTATWKNNRKYKYPSGKNSVSCADAVFLESGKWNENGGCGRVSTWPVGSKSQEINGTYDMAGNVWEWVEDWYGSYSGNDQRNPNGASSGSYRVYRGGSWDDPSADLRGASRSRITPTRRFSSLGFRCAVSP